MSLPSKFTSFKLAPGDRIEFRTACGGGYGDPRSSATRAGGARRARPADQRRARAPDYGVVLDPVTLELDAAATARERAAAEAATG